MTGWRWLLYCVYITILLFSLLFLSFFFWTIKTYKQKGSNICSFVIIQSKNSDKIPTTYIYAMMLCNLGIIAVELNNDIVPAFLTVETYYCKSILQVSIHLFKHRDD